MPDTRHPLYGKIPADALIFSYLRFSTSRQAGGDSERRQSKLRDDFLAAVDRRLCDNGVFFDAGVSSFRGRHRDPVNALGRFLELVRGGRVPRGSYLIVEALDRLSREAVDEATEMLLSLTNAGVGIVVLAPTAQLFRKPVEMTSLLLVVTGFYLSWLESENKSRRIAQAWVGRRQLARTQRRPISAKCPAWLRKDGDRYVPIPEKVAAVRRLFELVAGGKGIWLAIRQLEAEGVPSPGRSPKWTLGYSGSVLRNEAVVGLHQPRRNGKPVGEPFDLYPAVVDRDLFDRAAEGLRQRRQRGGGSGKNAVNFFRHLLFDVGGPEPEPMTYHHYRDARNPAIHYGQYVTAGKRSAAVRAVPLERAVLHALKEVKADEVVPPDAPARDEITPLRTKLTAVRVRLEKLQKQLQTVDADDPDADVDPVLAAVRALRAEESRLKAALAEKAAASADTAAAELEKAKSLADAVEAAPNQKDARRNLWLALLRRLTGVYCLSVRDGMRSAVLAQIHFRDSTAVRSVLYFYRPALTNVAGKVPEFASPPLTGKQPEWAGADVRVPALRRRVLKCLASLVSADGWEREVEPDRPTPTEAAAERGRRQHARRRGRPRTPPAGSDSVP